MKRIVHMLAICATLMVSAMTAQAAEQPVNVKEEARKAYAYLKRMQREEREAALTEMAGLLYMTDGSSAYGKDTGSEKVEVRAGKKVVDKGNVPYRRVKQGALFVGTDGKVYNFYAALPPSGANPHRKEAWKAAKLYMYRAGKQAIAARFVDELAEMEVQRGIHFLHQMPAELRQALFAEVLGLLYMDDGKDAFTGEVHYSTIGGERVPYQGYRAGARFVDAQGVSHSIEQVREEENKRGKAWRTWWPGVKLNMHRAGQERILAPFKAEIDAMRRHAAR